ncbi:hypothetical protein HPULCUR_001795 [Helicostylum pulchrum]|uniref:Uncharacterized protein n=1 Tax=Helicostylum pulchrum TaxID=562976 RepID=A0ABP9XNR6_9FUNG
MSDFPPPVTSAINNNSKNKKKKNNKKKNKKQDNVVRSPPVEGISYAEVAALPAEEEEEETVDSNDSSPPNERSASDATSDVKATNTAASDIPDTSRTKGSSAVEKPSAASSTKETLITVNTDTIPATGAPSFAEIAASAPSESPANTPSEPVSEIVEYTIQSVIASRSIHIDKIIDKIAKKVKAGEYNTSSVPAVSNKPNKASADESEQLRLSDLVKYSIDSVVASQSIGLYAIVDKIANNVKAGEYNTSSAKQTPSQVPTTTTTNASFQLTEPIKECFKSVIAFGSIDLYAIIDTISKKVRAGEYNTLVAKEQKQSHSTTSDGHPIKLTEPIKHGIKSAIASPSVHLHAIVDKVAKNVHAGEYKPLPKKDSQRPEKTLPEIVAGSAIAAVSSAVAGTAAVISDKLSATTEKTTKLSENVEHCIQSAVRARSIDVYAIIHPKANLKRPEAAVGETMPSSAKKADIVPPVRAVSPKKPKSVLPKKPDDVTPKKDKPLETRKPTLERKKKNDNCIIL